MDVFNLLYILKPPTSLQPVGMEVTRGRDGFCVKGGRGCGVGGGAGNANPNKFQKIKKNFKISLVVDKFFKARTWRHSNIENRGMFFDYLSFF